VVTQDITDTLAEWPFDPSKINARLVTGLDGRQRVQLRLDLGILQMELDGRPDGERPEGFDSWLDYYKSHAESFFASEEEGFALGPEDCARLHQEGVQYYHRYLSLFQLEDWTRVIRDTRRNLELFQFVRDYAANEELSWSLEQFTPYVLMMNTRARAMQALKQGHLREAVKRVEEGMRRMEEFFEDFDNTEWKESCAELEFLKMWLAELRGRLPLTPKEKIQKQLADAIAREDYEKAAMFRDQLQTLDPASNE
jgi:hypothetical protein